MILNTGFRLEKQESHWNTKANVSLSTSLLFLFINSSLLVVHQPNHHLLITPIQFYMLLEVILYWTVIVEAIAFPNNLPETVIIVEI